jgi:hypothetical protein
MKLTLIAAIILAAIALLHLLRLLLGWALIVGDLVIPVWPSVLVVVVFGLLAVLLWREARDISGSPPVEM